MLDTNTVSHIIKGTAPKIKDHLRQVPMSSLCISTITEAELRYGLAKKPESKTLHRGVQEFLLRVDILPWDSDASHSYAKLRVRIEDKGTPLSSLDLLIAAHSIAAQCILVTDDRSFYNIKPTLNLVNWTFPK